MKMKFVYSINPRFSDTDAYGVVHHSNYYKWYEEARIKFAVDALDITMDAFDKSCIKLPVVESYCNYRKAVVYEDCLEIEVIAKLHKSAKWTFYYKIINFYNNRVCATGYTVHVYLGEGNKILLNHPKWILDRVYNSLKNDKSYYIEIEEMEN